MSRSSWSVFLLHLPAEAAARSDSVLVARHAVDVAAVRDEGLGSNRLPAAATQEAVFVPRGALVLQHPGSCQRTRSEQNQNRPPRLVSSQSQTDEGKQSCSSTCDREQQKVSASGLHQPDIRTFNHFVLGLLGADRVTPVWTWLSFSHISPVSRLQYVWLEPSSAASSGSHLGSAPGPYGTYRTSARPDYPTGIMGTGPLGKTEH